MQEISGKSNYENYFPTREGVWIGSADLKYISQSRNFMIISSQNNSSRSRIFISGLPLIATDITVSLTDWEHGTPTNFIDSDFEIFFKFG